jgi:transketolase
VLYSPDEKFPVPGLKVHGAGDQVTIVGAGVTLYEALKAAEQLKARGIVVRVIDLYCVKPLDTAALADNVRATGGRVVTVEDHYAEGGIGEAVLSALALAGVALTGVRHLSVDRVPHSGKPEELVEAFGISAKHIVEAVDQLLQKK